MIEDTEPRMTGSYNEVSVPQDVSQPEARAIIAVLEKFCNHVSLYDIREGLDTLNVYAKNLIDNPQHERYHVISATNANFKDRLGHLPFSETMLTLIGYQRVGPQFQLDKKFENPDNYGYLRAKCSFIYNCIDQCRMKILKQIADFKHTPPEDHAFSGVQGVGVASRKGRRPTMEDEETVIDNFCSEKGVLYAGLYDGHGGRDSVEFVVKYLHQNIHYALLRLGSLPKPLLECWKSTTGFNASDGGIVVNNDYARESLPNAMSLLDLPKDATTSRANALREAFRIGYLQTDAQLRRSNVLRSGTTSVSVIIRTKIVNGTLHRFAHVANVGDSRAVLCRDGLARRMTVDHKATLPAEHMRIVSSGGHVANGRVNGVLAISRALGDHMLKEHDIVSAVPHTETVELLCGPAVQEKFARSNSPNCFEDKSKSVDSAEKKESVLSENTESDEMKTEGTPQAFRSGATFRQGDFFMILACDGIWDVLSDQQAVNQVIMFLELHYKNIPMLRSYRAAENVHMNASSVHNVLVDSNMRAQFINSRLMSASYSNAPESPEILLERAQLESIACNYSDAVCATIRDALYNMSPRDRNFLLQSASESLVSLAYQQGSSDNLTAMVILF